LARRVVLRIHGSRGVCGARNVGLAQTIDPLRVRMLRPQELMPAGKGGSQAHAFELTSYSKSTFCGVCSKLLVRFLFGAWCAPPAPLAARNGERGRAVPGRSTDPGVRLPACPIGAPAFVVPRCTNSTHARTHTHTRARAHTHARTHTHTHMTTTITTTTHPLSTVTTTRPPSALCTHSCPAANSCVRHAPMPVGK